MSRIDEALKIAERGSGVDRAEPRPVTPGSDSPLSQYRPEGAARPDPPPAAPDDRRSEAAEPFRPSPRSRRQGGKPSDQADLEARLVSTTESAVAVEQYRKVAAVLHEHQAEHKLKTVMITSALPHDGKTLTIVNLALTLSDSYGRRVLLIDADLRWPSLHGILEVPNRRGLSEVLHDGLHELPIHEVSSRLSVLTAGRPGTTPLAGLSSKRMADLIEECAARYDWVLIDSPPVGVLPDAQVVARLVGGVILVIGAGSTPAAAVERAIAELGGPETIIGTVLNRVEQRRIPDVDYYGQYGTSTARR